MKYVEALLKNDRYLYALKKIEEAEEDRVFCKHDFEHMLHVCRIAYIMNLENHLGLEKEMIYLYGLLHDIGRAAEYEQGLSHEQAGMMLAESILDEIRCPGELKHKVIREIGNHRSKPEDLCAITTETVFWQADKKARNCFLCTQKEACHWATEKRTTGINW